MKSIDNESDLVNNLGITRTERTSGTVAVSNKPTERRSRDGSLPSRPDSLPQQNFAPEASPQIQSESNCKQTKESVNPSLVGVRNNSRKTRCPNMRLIRGECCHGNVHWRYIPCRRRDCEVCGPLGRYRIAEKIAYGIREVGKCAWITLTFADDIDKKLAVRKLTRFIAKLREMTGRHLEYAVTWELTKRGRLHGNLLIGPWTYIKQSELEKKWGAILWVEWIKDDLSVGRETSKAYSPESLGNYVSKLEQCVPDDRRVSFSRGWPKMPESGLKRKGQISWREPEDFSYLTFEDELEKGYWREYAGIEGEYEQNSKVLDYYGCDCFDFVKASKADPVVKRLRKCKKEEPEHKNCATCRIPGGNCRDCAGKDEWLKTIKAS